MFRWLPPAPERGSFGPAQEAGLAFLLQAVALSLDVYGGYVVKQGFE